MTRSNLDPGCAQPLACPAKGPRLCRGCTIKRFNEQRTKSQRKAAAVKGWTRPGAEDRKARVAALMADPVVRARASANLREAYADPEVKARHKEACKKAHSTPEARANYSAVRRAAAHDQARRALLGAAKRKETLVAKASRRAKAKALTNMAGAPLLRRLVDVADRMLAEGADEAAVLVALQEAA